MIDTFHEDKLSVRPLGMGLILKRPTQLFNGNVSLEDLIISGTGKQTKCGQSIRRHWRARVLTNRLILEFTAVLN